MLNLFCKTLVRVRLSCTKKPQNYTLCVIYQNPISHLSHILKNINFYSTSSEKESFAVSYLVNACGFSLQSAKSISKHVAFDNPEKPNSVLAFLRSRDFSDTQILDFVKKCPILLLFNPEKTLIPKYDFLISKGFSKSSLARLLSRNSSILTRSLRDSVIPTFNYLKSWLGSDEKTHSAITRYSRLLSIGNIQIYLGPNIKTMQDYGVTRSRIIWLLCRHPAVLLSKAARFREIAVTVKEMGLDPSKAAFVRGIVVMASLTKSNWERRVQTLKSWGWSDVHINAAFVKCPYYLTTSDDKIMQIMDFIVNKVGWEASWLLKAPVVFGLSLDGRTIPRALVLQFLISKQLVKRDSRLVGYMTYSEKNFLQRFVKPHKEMAPQLLEIYTAKLHHSKKRNEVLSAKLCDIHAVIVA